MSLYIVVFVFAFLLLARSSDILVRSITNLARFFKLSEYVVSFVLMSVATSVPELFVGFSAAFRGVSDFAFGNVLGTNLVNVTLVMGLIIVFGKGLQVESKISRRNFWIISAFAFLPFLFALDGVVSRLDGVILLFAFAFYMSMIVREKEYFTKTVNHLRPKFYLDAKIFKTFLWFFAGAALLVLSSFAIVWSGEALALSIGMSTFIFAIVFVAVGTSLPELAFGIRARVLKHDAMTVGSTLGSIAFNASLIVAIVSIVNPIYVDLDLAMTIIILATLLSLLLFNFFVYSRSFISRREGFILIFVYFVFLFFEYFVYGF